LEIGQKSTFNLIEKFIILSFFGTLIFVIYSKTYSGENNIIGEKKQVCWRLSLKKKCVGDFVKKRCVGD